ncbi:MAG TPA: hypothetical protein VEH76_07930 [Methylocystis sp.]|nr:hypothetical protein [Methylocystis sp.]
MTVKVEIVRRLGEPSVLLPSLLAEALNANDRVKLRMTMLQEAASAAAGRSSRSFETERRAVGLSDAQFDHFITGARAVGAERLAIPGVNALLAGALDDIAAMLAPIEAVEPETAKSMQGRLRALEAGLGKSRDDILDRAEISRLTSARKGSEDSLHLLVMDAHKAINRIAVATAVELIDGAHAHHLEPADKARVAAFMRGLNRTAALAFGHPGLATTACRVGARLTIQNDIGATEAHVLVIHVEEMAVAVTYTDVHAIRADFFCSLFRNWMIEWSALAERAAEGLGKEDAFYLVTGSYSAASQEELDAFLEFLGSRIVFLIDWNKGRKALQIFVGKKAAIDILTWAADNDLGHRAFLELGGADLVFEAVRHVAAGCIPYGARLDEALGDEDSVDFLRHVLKEASGGLQAGRSARLIRDQVQADLAQRFESAESAVLTIVERHLGLSRTLASAIWSALAHRASVAERASLVRRSKLIEEKADRLTLAAREACLRLRDSAELRLLIDEIENATDLFDEAAFLVGLLPEVELEPALVDQLAALAEIAMLCAGELIRAVTATARLPEGKRSDAAFALQAIDAVGELERSADAAQRSALAAFVGRGGADARILVVGVEIARAIESATDRLAHAAHALRNRVLKELSA